MVKKIFVLVSVFILQGCFTNKTAFTEEKNKSNFDPVVLKYFGKINSENTESSIWINNVLINNYNVTMDLNFPNDSDHLPLLKKVKPTLNLLEEITEQSRKDLEIDFKNSGTSKDYIDLHLDSMQKEDYEFLKIDDQSGKDKLKTALLKTTELRRIGFYPNDSNDYLIFDYSLSKNRKAITNYLLVFKYDINLKLVDVTIES